MTQDSAPDPRVAIVTGASSGIGEAAAVALGARGFAVMVADLDRDGGERVVGAIEAAGGQAMFIATDVSDPDANQALVDAALGRYGRLDAAVNNAGIGGDMAPLGDYTPEMWRKVLSINLDGVFYGVRAQLPPMLEAGGGAIINVASILGQVAFPNAPAYVAAKHGVVGLTKQLALEYSARGIRATALGPGYINTPLLARPELAGEARTMLEDLHPIGRLGESEEVGALIAWLAADAPPFLTGAYIPIDGGYLTR